MSDWTKNPDVLELLQYNREAKQNTCPHPTFMGSGWSCLCTACWKTVPYWETVVGKQEETEREHP